MVPRSFCTWLTGLHRREIALPVLTFAVRRFARVPASVSGYVAEQRVEHWGIANMTATKVPRPAQLPAWEASFAPGHHGQKWLSEG
ncbi:hypothetical protein ABHI18_009707, partial [Aspergillus niger]